MVNREKDVIVPDTSVIINGILSKLLDRDEISTKRIIIPNAVISELQHQANMGKSSGFIGLSELDKIVGITKRKNITLEYLGRRPSLEEIRLAKSGYIDYIIIEVAKTHNALLLTSDKVMELAAKAMGVDVLFIETLEKKEKLYFEKFFTEDTTSVHIIEGVNIRRKRGHPGNWYLEELEDIMYREDIIDLIEEILEYAKIDIDSNIEIDRKNSIIVQLRDYRIVIVKPPVSKRYEITIVKPIKKLKLEEYSLPEKVIKRFEEKAEGIIISGPPGSGKTTFVQALAEWYNSMGKIVKTVESPRDLNVIPEITQYSKNFASSQEIHDILLLSRPDYVVFDEMRDTPDFELYKDLRLAGVGMIGVVHAERPIDAIQRFISRTELGMIPQIVDTVIFIYGGEIKKVYEVYMTVKVPTGMTDEDLARPVVEVRDFITRELEYEMYTFGEEIVVIPISKSKRKEYTKVEEIVIDTIEKEIRKVLKIRDVKVELSGNRAIIYVPERLIKKLIGKKGKRIAGIEKKLGIKISVKPLQDIKEFGEDIGSSLKYKIDIKGNKIIIRFGQEYANRKIRLYLNGMDVGDFIINKKGDIVIKRNEELYDLILNAIDSGEHMEFVLEE